MKSRWVLIIFVLAVLGAGVSLFALSDRVQLLVLGLYGVTLYGNPSTQDREEVEAVVHTITSAHSFSEHVYGQPDRPPVYWEAGSSRLLSNPANITVYDILDRTEQDRVIEEIKSLVVTRRFQPVELAFIDHENWIINGDSQERGPETQLRRVRIDRNGVREIAGRRSITYPSP